MLFKTAFIFVVYNVPIRYRVGELPYCEGQRTVLSDILLSARARLGCGDKQKAKKLNEKAQPCIVASCSAVLPRKNIVPRLTKRTRQTINE